MEKTLNATNVGDFSRKIKSASEIRALIGERPRSKTVVMCHGTFDIVHPGHLRHLMYAKERADILIASLTCDEHIYKANLRPFVPQELRALNLAALELVDYVLIDNRDVPIENIKLIEPDLFAKGFDYFQTELSPKTRDEIAALESYGGEILFTPGDVVYSSSTLIDTAPPNLSAEKLHILMKSENITFDLLRDTVKKFADLTVHVVGDTIVDSYTYTRAGGGTTKTPTVSVQFEKQVDYVGGAGVVAKHMSRAGAKVVFTTVLGDDNLKDFVLHDIQENNITCQPIIDKSRPTTQKNAIIAQGYHLLRMSKVDNRIISQGHLANMTKAIESTECDVCIFSDFRHGIFNRSTIPQLTKAIPSGALKVADSQVASRWGNILEFKGFDLITPNEREARFALGDQDSVVRPLASELYSRAECKYLIMTLGERGLMTYRQASWANRSFFTMDSFADKVVDAIGTGDALLAYSTLALTATNSIVIASILGAFAAAIACEREGNNPVSSDDLLERINLIEKRCSHITFSIESEKSAEHHSISSQVERERAETEKAGAPAPSPVSNHNEDRVHTKV